MRVSYIGTQNAGLIESREIPDGTTISTFFNMVRGEHSSPGDYVIMINGQQPEADQVLNDGDEVIVSPAKVAGASA